MNAFNHYATLFVAAILTGQIIGHFLSPPASYVMVFATGIFLGLTWRHITGYDINRRK